jgi:hypothetical protein
MRPFPFCRFNLSAISPKEQSLAIGAATDHLMLCGAAPSATAAVFEQEVAFDRLPEPHCLFRKPQGHHSLPLSPPCQAPQTSIVP